MYSFESAEEIASTFPGDISIPRLSLNHSHLLCILANLNKIQLELCNIHTCTLPLFIADTKCVYSDKKKRTNGIWFVKLFIQFAVCCVHSYLTPTQALHRLTVPSFLIMRPNCEI